MGTANFTGYTATGRFGGMAASAQMGGGSGGLNNDIPRAYAYPETLPVQLPPAVVTTPQPFTIFYTDATGVLWLLIKNGTVWTIVEQGT